MKNKVLKYRIFITAIMMVGVVTFMNCEKNDNSKIENKIQQRKYDDLLPITEECKEYKKISQSKEFLEFNTELFGDMNYDEMYIYYPSIDSNFYAIVINTFDSYETENKKELTRLIAVFKKGCEEPIQLTFRSEAIKYGQGEFIAGQEVYYSNSGRYIGSRLYNTDSFIFQPLSERTIHLKEAYKDFNDCYQTKKKICENDWLCDVACSFNPCAVSYAVACVIDMYILN